MTLLRDPSVDEFRRQSESARAALADTVTKLRAEVADTATDIKTRISPAHIKKEVGEYVREGSEQLFITIERKARENPLQAVALGAGLAYPFWGLLKTVPMPLMFIGAGLWLSKQKNSEHYVQDVAGSVSEKGAEIADSIRDAQNSLGADVAGIAQKVKTTARDVGESVTDMAQTATAAVADSAENAADSVLATASVLREKGVQLGNQSRNTFEDLVARNPLLVAGVGLAIGAFIAASLPTSNVESRLFGESSEEVKDKALKAASRGMERAKDVAAGVVGDVAAAAAREGLTVEGVTKAVEGVTEAVRSVVDKGLKTALGGEDIPAHSQTASNQQKSAHGEF